MAAPVPLIATIDQGTQSTRVVVYTSSLRVLASAQKAHKQLYPNAGWVEHDPVEIIDVICALFVEATAQLEAQLGRTCLYKIQCVGITNQRETVVAWDRTTGHPLYNAIVWLDTRTKDVVDSISERVGGADALRHETGLPVSTYFSGTKMRWMIDHVSEVREAVDAKRCYFGTLDTWIIWNLTGGPVSGVYVTDITNASRTQLMDLSTCNWSDKLLGVFGIPRECLPEIRSSAEVYGKVIKCGTTAFENVPISGCAGDQQAACIGQGVFRKGLVKCTYGTGAFILINTGTTAVPSSSGLLTTPCYQLGPDAPVVYALDGSIAIAGAAVTWLRDNLGAINEPHETEALITSVNNTAGTYFVPAFSGLFAPRWRRDARGCIVGLTQHTKKAHIVRAVMESVGFQLREIIVAMLTDMKMDKLELIRVDGGMSRNNPFLQMTANLCGCIVERPENPEVTSIGAAVAAGLGIGFWKSTDEIEAYLLSSSRRWHPEYGKEERERKIKNWNKAVERSLNWV